MAAKSYVCPDCGIEFSSKLRFESHIRANSEESFLSSFVKVASNEVRLNRFPNGNAMLEAEILPRQEKLAELRRAKGGFKNNKAEEPQKSDHINVKTDKTK